MKNSEYETGFRYSEMVSSIAMYYNYKSILVVCLHIVKWFQVEKMIK